MTKKNELNTKQVHAIGTATASVFNSQQQAAILKAIKIALNPQDYEDVPQPEAEDAQAQVRRQERAQAEADAAAVKAAQEQARIIDEAKATPNVLNQGNYDQVVESTREAVKARDPDVALENAREGRSQAKAEDAKASKKVK